MSGDKAVNKCAWTFKNGNRGSNRVKYKWNVKRSERSVKMRTKDEVKKMLNKALHPCGVRVLSQKEF